MKVARLPTMCYVLIERRMVDDVRFPEMKKQVEFICKYFLEGGKIMEMDSKQRESRSLSAPGLFDYIGTFSDTNSTIAQPFKYVACEIPSTTKLFELKILGSDKDGLNFVKLVDVELCFDIDNFKVSIMRELGLCVIAHSYATGTGAYNVNILLAPEDVDLNHTINIDLFSNIEPSQLSINSYASSPTVSGTSFTRIYPNLKFSEDPYYMITHVDRWSVLKIPEKVNTIVVKDYTNYIYLIKRIVRLNGEAFTDGTELTLMNSANNVGGNGLAFLNDPSQETGVGAILPLPEAKWWIGNGDYTGTLTDNVTKYRTLIPNVIVKLVSCGGKWIPQLIPSPNACIGEVDPCGFREGSEWADFNFYRLQALLANKVKTIDLKGKTIYIHLNSNLNLDYALHLCNGTINVASGAYYDFTVSSGFSIKMMDLNINDPYARWNMFVFPINDPCSPSCENPAALHGINFSIDYIHIVNCNLNNIRTLINLEYCDFTISEEHPEDYPKVHSLKIINSKIIWDNVNNERFNGIRIQNAVFGSIKITNNSFINYNVAINFGRDNDYTNAEVASSKSGTADISNNYFDGGTMLVGDGTEYATYHCAVLSEQHETMFCNNIIVKCVTVNNSTLKSTATYDNYLSDDIVICANNTIHDIISFGSNENMLCEIFKSKAYNNPHTMHTRSFLNNVVEIHPEAYEYYNANTPVGMTIHSTNVGYYMDSVLLDGNRIYAPQVKLLSSYFYAVNFVCRNNSYRFIGVNNNIPRNLFQFHPMESDGQYPNIENIDIENNIIEFVGTAVGVLKLSSKVNNAVKIINNTFINCLGYVLSRIGDNYIPTTMIEGELNVSSNKYINVSIPSIVGTDLRVAPTKYYYERYLPGTAYGTNNPLQIYTASTNVHMKLICPNALSVANSEAVLARINFNKMNNDDQSILYYRAKLTVEPDGNPISAVLYLKYSASPNTVSWCTRYDGTYTASSKLVEVGDYKAYIQLATSGQLRLYCSGSLSYMVKPHPMTFELETIPYTV